MPAFCLAVLHKSNAKLSKLVGAVFFSVFFLFYFTFFIISFVVVAFAIVADFFYFFIKCINFFFIIFSTLHFACSLLHLCWYCFWYWQICLICIVFGVASCFKMVNDIWLLKESLGFGFEFFHLLPGEIIPFKLLKWFP